MGFIHFNTNELVMRLILKTDEDILREIEDDITREEFVINRYSLPDEWIDDLESQPIEF